MPPREKKRRLNVDAEGNPIRLVRLRPGEQQKDYFIDVEKSVAFKSNVIKNMISDFGDRDEVIPIRAVPPPVMEKVIEWCKHHQKDPDPPTNDTDEERRWLIEISEWDQNFLQVEYEMLLEIVLAANFLEILPLLDVACKTVANSLQGKTPDEIREMLNIENDLTPEEEAQIKHQNEWATF